MPTSNVKSIITELQKNGVRFDVDQYQREEIVSIQAELQGYKNKLYELVGYRINVDRYSDICKYLASQGHIVKTEDLQEFLKDNQYRNLVLWNLYQAMKKIQILKVFHPDKLRKYCDKANRIHPQWHISEQTTGRLVCSNPPLQSMPSNSRRFIIPNDGYSLVTVDFSTIELRVLAKLTGDPSLIHDLGPGGDIHRKTAAAVFGKAPEDVTTEERQIGKQVNFMIAYGGSEKGLSAKLSVETGKTYTEAEAARMLYSFFDAYPLVYHYRYCLINGLKQPTTLKGRQFTKLKPTKLLNYPVQASAAEGFIDTLCEIISKKPPNYKLVMAIHDSITLEVPEECNNEAGVFLKSVSEGTMGTFLSPVPVFTEFKDHV